MDGGNGLDKLWYDESENPSVPCPAILLSQSSTAGGGNSDKCGDNNDYTTGQLPQSCENYLTDAPNKCEGAN